MKDSSLAVSLGLAAIDGLTCAFIAILILALILIGAGSSPGASDKDTSQVLMVDITRDVNTQGTIDLHVLVDISVNGQLPPTAFEVESNGRMVRVDRLDDYLRPGGGVWWKDCQTMDGKECMARLLVTKVKYGPVWRVRLRVADAGESFTAGPVAYKVWLKTDSGPKIDNLVLNPDQPVVACVDWNAKTVTPCP